MSGCNGRARAASVGGPYDLSGSSSVIRTDCRARILGSRLRDRDGKVRFAASSIRRCDLGGTFAYRLGTLLQLGRVLGFQPVTLPARLPIETGPRESERRRAAAGAYALACFWLAQLLMPRRESASRPMRRSRSRMPTAIGTRPGSTNTVDASPQSRPRDPSRETVAEGALTR
jgi:hypothetical protein